MYAKLFAVVLFALGCASVSLAATAVSLDTENPDYPGKCWVADHKLALDVGEDWEPDRECLKITCSEGFKLDFLGCGEVVAGKGYRVQPGDPSEPYPDCCEKIIKLD